jgi:hypothetical protein
MAGSASDWAEIKILEHLVGKTTWPLPTVVYAALCTAGPGDAGSGGGINEVADANNYSRVNTSGLWGSASAGAISNSSAITFPQASGSWGTVTHMALCTSAAWGEGAVLVWFELTTPKPVTDGDTPEFAIGDVDITCD